jgi:hypothetical protein
MLTFSVCVAAVAAAVDFRQTDYAFRIGPGSAISGHRSRLCGGIQMSAPHQTAVFRAQTISRFRSGLNERQFAPRLAR